MAATQAAHHFHGRSNSFTGFTSPRRRILAWTPFITTPCFPSYPSAHASASHAARTIAEKVFGSGNHDLTLSHPAIPGVTLHYTKFSQMTDDIDDTRVYGGIHFRFDQEAGARQGRRVGSFVYRNNLRCSHDDEDCGDDE